MTVHGVLFGLASVSPALIWGGSYGIAKAFSRYRTWITLAGLVLGLAVGLWATMTLLPPCIPEADGDPSCMVEGFRLIPFMLVSLGCVGARLMTWIVKLIW